MEPLQSKATILRASRSVLARRGLLAPVRARISATARELLDDPPPGSTWFDARVTAEIYAAVEALEGPDAVRAVSRDVALEGVIPVLRPVLEAFMRLFGVSPGALFARLNRMMESTARGVEFEYASTSEHSGVLTVRVPSGRDVPRAMFLGIAGSLEIVYELCSVDGTASDPTMIADAPSGTAARITLEWRARR